MSFIQLISLWFYKCQPQVRWMLKIYVEGKKFRYIILILAKTIIYWFFKYKYASYLFYICKFCFSLKIMNAFFILTLLSKICNEIYVINQLLIFRFESKFQVSWKIDFYNEAFTFLYMCTSDILDSNMSLHPSIFILYYKFVYKI